MGAPRGVVNPTVALAWGTASPSRQKGHQKSGNHAGNGATTASPPQPLAPRSRRAAKSKFPRSPTSACSSLSRTSDSSLPDVPRLHLPFTTSESPVSFHDIGVSGNSGAVQSASSPTLARAPDRDGPAPQDGQLRVGAGPQGKGSSHESAPTAHFRPGESPGLMRLLSRRSPPRPPARRAPPSRRLAARWPSSSMSRPAGPGRSSLWRGRPRPA
jgi:hypothetical protein